MSEYQYYEFQAIDRPLTREEQEAVASLSSRVQPHPRRAVFVYNYSDFRGNPEQVLAKYYDAMFYLANWGSRHLLFRFPAALVDAAAMAQYSVESTSRHPPRAITVETMDEYVVLGIRLDEEEGFGWVDGEGWLDRLLDLREGLLQRDYRVLYLAWLKGITLDPYVDREALEPPVPPGLNELSPALRTFVEIFGVDANLLSIAAEHSAALKMAAVDEAQLRRTIAGLPVAEKDAFLLRLLQDEPRLSLSVRQRLGLMESPFATDIVSRRTASELLEAAGFEADDL